MTTRVVQALFAVALLMAVALIARPQQEPPATRQYRIVYGQSWNSETMEKHLNAAAAEGWRVVGVINAEGSAPRFVMEK